MKKYRSVIILSVLLILSVAVYLIIMPKKDTDSPTGGDDTDKVTEEYPIPSPDIDSLTEISYTYNGKSYRYRLNDDSSLWLWDEDPELILDNEYFAYMASAFKDMKASKKLENVTDEELKSYGLDTPAVSISYKDLENGVLEYHVGIKNSFNGLYYLSKVGEKHTVYMVSGDFMEYFKHSPDDMLLLDEIPKIGLTSVISVGYSANGRELLCRYVADEAADSEGKWYVSVGGAPEIYVGDELSAGMSAMFDTLKFDSFVTYDRDKYSEYGFDTPIKVEIKYRQKSSANEENGQSVPIILDKSYVFCLGNKSEDGVFYAKAEGSPYIYKILPTSIGNILAAEFDQDK